MNTKSLVDEIKACLRNGSPEQDVRRLGSEYLTAFNQASNRLKRCVELIRQEKDSTALQEAQFAPPLMEVLEALSFSQFQSFGEEMAKIGMTPPSSFDGNQVAMMGKLYAKPIDGTDPLYSDLAHAMRTKDRPKALNILRIIRRKNPSDSNAAGQLAKIETVIQTEKISELVGLAREKNEGWFSEAMSVFNSDPWENEPEGEDWNEVMAYDQSLRKASALARCKKMIESLLSIRKKGNWKDAVGLIAQVDALVEEYGFGLQEKLPDMPDHAYKGIVELAKKWIATEKDKERKKGEDKEREDGLKVVIRSIQDQEVGRKRKTSELRESLASLTSVGRDLEQVGQSLSEDDLKNFNRCLLNLRDEISKRQKHFRILMALGCLVAIAVAGTSFFLISERLRWNEQFETLVEGIKSNKNAETLEAVINSFEKNNPERIDEMEFETEIKKGRDFILEARSFNDQFGRKIQDFDKKVEGADDLPILSQLQGEKNLLRDDLNRINSAYREKREQQLREIDLKWNDQRDRLQAGISASLASKMSSAGEFALKNLGTDQPPEGLKTNLVELNRQLVDLETEAEKYSGVAGLGLTEGQQDVLVSLRASYDQSKDVLTSFEDAVTAMGDVDSLESLFNTLEKIIASGFIGSPHYQSAKKTLLSRTLFSDLEARTFMPRNPQLWQTAANSMTAKYKSGEILPKEAEPLTKLYAEKRIKNIYKTPFFSSSQMERFEKTGNAWKPVAEDSARAVKWTVGKTMPIELEFKQGSIGFGSYVLSQKAEIISSKTSLQETFKSEWRGISKTFEIIEATVAVKGDMLIGGEISPFASSLSTESKYLYDESSPIMDTYSPPKVNKAPLLLLDSLKGKKLDPFVKSRIFLALMESMAIRPHEWGLRNNPLGNLSAEEDYLKLTKLVGQVDLIAEWYGFLSSGKETKLRKDLKSFFALTTQVSYFKEARFYEKFWGELLGSKFVFRGYCTLEDKWSEPVTEYTSWGLSTKEGNLKIVQENGRQTVPYSPIMTLNKDFSTILSDARAHAGYANSKDANYQRILRGLPYPFQHVTE
jgi:hypothetical protein